MENEVKVDHCTHRKNHETVILNSRSQSKDLAYLVILKLHWVSVKAMSASHRALR